MEIGYVETQCHHFSQTLVITELPWSKNGVCEVSSLRTQVLNLRPVYIRGNDGVYSET